MYTPFSTTIGDTTFYFIYRGDTPVLIRTEVAERRLCPTTGQYL